MIYLTIALGVIIIYLCQRIFRGNKNSGSLKYILHLEEQLRESRRLLKDTDSILAQVGELLDHAGVDLECGQHKQAANDLKLLGSVLRTERRIDLLDLSFSQNSLAELGERYGIEPENGEYSVRKVVQIAEQAIESVLTYSRPVQH